MAMGCGGTGGTLFALLMHYKACQVRHPVPSLIPSLLRSCILLPNRGLILLARTVFGHGGLPDGGAGILQHLHALHHLQWQHNDSVQRAIF